MSWFIKQDTLFRKGSDEIGFFLPTATAEERSLIKNGEDLVDLIGELVVDYDNGKTPLKSVFNRFSKIVDQNLNYKKVWFKTPEGNLVNESDSIIFIFKRSDQRESILITHLPEAYIAVQELLKNLSSTNRQNTKKIYDKICDFYDKILSE